MPAEMATGGDPRWEGVYFDACPVALSTAPWIGVIFRLADLIVGEHGGGVSIGDTSTATRGLLDALHTIQIERAALSRQLDKDAAASMDAAAARGRG